MRVEFPYSRYVSMAFALCILIAGAPILGAQGAGDNAPAQASEAPAPVATRNPVAPHPALVFFSQHRLPESAWAALFTAMRANLPEAAAEIPALDAHAELIRGDELARETVVPESVTVYLHGDCNLSPMTEPFPQAEPLGWVLKVGPRIEPVIHVECTPIGEEISQRTEWLSAERRRAAMSEALTRVILHEWAHIATQSSAHRTEGITKAEFGVDDLVPAGREAQLSAPGLR
jgi:hypothetical protein